MPARSVAQRRFFAMCEHGVHTRTSCPDMPKSQMREWATTSEKGLPHRVATHKNKPKLGLSYALSGGEGD